MAVECVYRMAEDNGSRMCSRMAVECVYSRMAVECVYSRMAVEWQ